MKLRLLCVLLLCVFISGCSSIINLPSGLIRLSALQSQSRSLADDLRIINSNAIVNRGDFGFITIQGRPQTRYRITTSFRRGNRIIPVNQWRVTGSNGQATFNWVVDPETTPGTYPAIISGVGRSLNTYHTVNP